ncbi:hypothetical protein ACFHW2_23225 [Actinomadura sp. LOL_016]|uniref:hypothetical protein n=1 Tax=unclassified Actinomadura TaxID=2626254 RepID=UPI003A80CF60
MRRPPAPGRVLAGAAGLALIAFGLHGVVTHVEVTGWGVWFAAVVLAHDAVLVPAVLAAGRLTLRLPAAARAPVRAGLVAGGCLTLVALPLVLGHGRRADVPSRLPLPYGRNLAAVLTAIAVAAAVVAAVRVLRARARVAAGTDARDGPACEEPALDGPGAGEIADGAAGREDVPPPRHPTSGPPHDETPNHEAPNHEAPDGVNADRETPDDEPRHGRAPHGASAETAGSGDGEGGPR